MATARRYRGRGVSMEDLVNEGNLGLLKAAERFDPDRGVRFVTYAAWFVRQTMLEAVARAGRFAPAPPSGGRPRPTVLVSLEASRDPDGNGATLSELLIDPSGSDAGGPVDRHERRHALEKGLAFLPDREERVLRLFFGLDGRGSRSLARIARELGVSRSRIRQLKDRALGRLRDGPLAGRLRSLRD